MSGWGGYDVSKSFFNDFSFFIDFLFLWEK